MPDRRRSDEHQRERRHRGGGDRRVRDRGRDGGRRPEKRRGRDRGGDGRDEDEDEETRMLERARRYVEDHESGEKRGGDSRSGRKERDRDRKRHGRHRRDNIEGESHGRRQRSESLSGSRSRDEEGGGRRERHRDGGEKLDDGRKSPRKEYRRHKHSRGGFRSRSRGHDDSRSIDRERERRHGKMLNEDDHDRQKKKRKKHDQSNESGRRDRDRHRKSKGSDDRSQEKIDRSSLHPLGPSPSSPPKDKLDPEVDYFAYHPHLRLYLYREEGVRFEDLTSSQTHKAFVDFVKKYNAGILEGGYYDSGGPPARAMEECGRTRHAWAFRTNEVERRSLDVVKAGVKKQTEYDKKQAGVAATASSSSRPIGPPLPAGVTAERPGVEPRRERKTPEELLADRAANRRLREHVRTAEEEFGGGRSDLGSRERALEKRRERSAATHGAARDREDAAMGGVELGDSAVYGDDGGNSYREALERERKRAAAREGKKAARVEELKKKEEGKQAAMLKMPGLEGIQPGQKITIAPRKER